MRNRFFEDFEEEEIDLRDLASWGMPGYSLRGKVRGRRRPGRIGSER